MHLEYIWHYIGKIKCTEYMYGIIKEYKLQLIPKGLLIYQIKSFFCIPVFFKKKVHKIGF